MTNTVGYSIIAAEFNKTLLDAMLGIALEEFRSQGLHLAQVLRVPGAYELPLVADIELSKPSVSGLVVLAYIEKGETLHGEVMGHVVSRALVELQIKFRKPIGIGIIGPGATREQAEVRHVGSAKAAVHAMKHLAELLQNG